MMSARTAEVLLACALLAGASLAGASRASAQPATLSNAELKPHSAAAGLQATLDGLRPSLSAIAEHAEGEVEHLVLIRFDDLAKRPLIAVA